MPFSRSYAMIPCIFMCRALLHADRYWAWFLRPFQVPFSFLVHSLFMLQLLIVPSAGDQISTSDQQGLENIARPN